MDERLLSCGIVRELFISLSVLLLLIYRYLPICWTIIGNVGRFWRDWKRGEISGGSSDN